MGLGRIQKTRLWLALLPMLALALASAGARADITPDEVKASYIIKLRPFIMLGNPPHALQKICYYEKPGTAWNESVGQIIAKYLEKNPERHGAPVSVQWFRAIGDFSGCDVFYISADEEDNIDNILAALGSTPTLTISDAPRFIFRGGMIGFVLDDTSRVKMVANVKNSKARNVQIDAQILEIMQQVTGQ